ncbi:MAG: sugar phosphate isomerase/epimerase family protein [Thermoguttaceae bacterium]
MFVSASTGCFANLSIPDALEKLSDLEYTAAEIVVDEEGPLRAADLESRFDELIQLCRTSRRITPSTIHFNVDPLNENYFDYFTVCSKLAKATKIVTISVLPAKLGTPFNAEVERLKKLVNIGVRDGAHVSLVTMLDTLTENPDTLGSLCKTVNGLTVCLDPTHFIYSCPKPKEYDPIIEYITHVRLRDSTKDMFQVQIGQGIVEYGKLVIQLNKVGYRRALCVDLAVLPNLDPIAELRKMRLLLESLL